MKRVLFFSIVLSVFANTNFALAKQATEQTADETSLESGRANDPGDISEERMKVIVQLLLECPRFVENDEWQPSGERFVKGWLRIGQSEQALLTVDAILEHKPEWTALVTWVADYWLAKDRPEKVLELFDRYKDRTVKLVGQDRPANTVFDKLFFWYCKNQDYGEAFLLADRLLKHKPAEQLDQYLRYLNWHAAELAATNDDFLVAEDCLQQCTELKYPNRFMTIQACWHGRYELAMFFFQEEHTNLQPKLLKSMASIMAHQRNRKELNKLLAFIRVQPGWTNTDVRCRVIAIKNLSGIRPATPSDAKWRNELLDSTLELVKRQPYRSVTYDNRRDLCEFLLFAGRLPEAIELAELNCPADQGFHSGLDAGVGLPFAKWVSESVKSGRLPEAIAIIQLMSNPTLQSESAKRIDVEDLQQFPPELQRQFMELDIRNRLTYTRNPNIKENMRYHYLEKARTWLLEMGQLERLADFDREFDWDSSQLVKRRQLFLQIQNDEPVKLEAIKNLDRDIVSEFVSELVSRNRVTEAIELCRTLPKESMKHIGTRVIAEVIVRPSAAESATALAAFLKAFFSVAQLDGMHEGKVNYFIKDSQTSFAVWSTLADSFPECGWVNSLAAMASAWAGQDKKALQYAFSDKHSQTYNAVMKVTTHPHSKALLVSLVDRVNRDTRLSVIERDKFFANYVTNLVEQDEFDSALEFRTQINSPEKRAWTNIRIIDGLLGE